MTRARVGGLDVHSGSLTTGKVRGEEATLDDFLLAPGAGLQMDKYWRAFASFSALLSVSNGSSMRVAFEKGRMDDLKRDLGAT